ncbi:MAG: hypothetical protein JXC32_07975 [Anaerolineae bacterium]|nr:hypothetical protein [Anaerolineae bacterium]
MVHGDARRNAHYTLIAGILVALGSVFAEALALFDTAKVAILGLALAGIVQPVSQLIYAPRQVHIWIEPISGDWANLTKRLKSNVKARGGLL